MASRPDFKKRRRDTVERPRRHKKIRKVQQHYSSGSDSEVSQNDEFSAANLADSDSEAATGNRDEEAASVHSRESSNDPIKMSATTAESAGASQSSLSESETDSETDSDADPSQPVNPNRTRLSKRNDPAAFANSIAAILSSKLTSTKRADPVLARSATAAQANTEIASERLDAQARQKLRGDKRAALEKGRVRDVLLGTDAPGRAGEEIEDGEKVKEIQEVEKRLKKTAQRGVVKLFNAVRQAQVRAEEAAKDKAIVGRGRREEKVAEMSKKGFLELVAGGGGDVKMRGANIEEA